MSRRFAASVACLATAFVIALPSTSWAPRVMALPSYLGACTMDIKGTPTSGRFQGSAMVVRFDSKGSDLIAAISVSGTCSAGGENTGVVEDSQTVAQVVSATCDSLSLRLGTAVVGGVVIDFSGADILVTADKKSRGAFCRVAKAGGRQPVAKLASWLNEILTR